MKPTTYFYIIYIYSCLCLYLIVEGDRYENKDREVNRLDLENIDFHRKVYQGYLSLCDKFPNRIVKIDASLDIDHVYQQVLKKIREIL